MAHDPCQFHDQCGTVAVVAAAGSAAGLVAVIVFLLSTWPSMMMMIYLWSAAGEHGMILYCVIGACTCAAIVEGHR